jgi:hypothetical protein
MTVELLFFFAPQVSFSCGWEDQYNCKAYYYVLLCPDARRKYREESLWQVWRRADRTGYLYRNLYCLEIDIQNTSQHFQVEIIKVCSMKRLSTQWRPGKEQCRGLLSCCRPTVTLTKGEETQKRYWVSWKMVENLTGLNLRAHQ